MLRFNSVLIVVLVGAFLACPAFVHAVDYKLKPVADGHKSFTGSGSGTTWSLGAQYAEGYYSSGCRIVMKFDTSSISAYTLLKAKLYMFGGRNSYSASSSLTKVYHYSYDGWSESSIPYPSDSDCRYLAEKTISNLLTADYIGTSQWHAYDIGSSLTGWDADGYLSLALRSFDGSHMFAGVSFVSRNSVTWDGSVGKEPYIVFETWGSTSVQNTAFADGLGTEWSVTSGGGSATAVDNPYDDGTDQMVEIITGSPVTISQILDTPADPFYIVLDYEFQTTSGWLDVSLTDRDGIKTVIGTLTAPAVLESGMNFAWFGVDDPSLLGLDNATLGLKFDGVTSSQIWIDNVEFSNVPEPMTLSLLGLGGLALIRRRRK